MKKGREIFVSVIIGVVIAIGFIFFRNHNQNKDETAQKKKDLSSIQVGYSPLMVNLPLMVAFQNDYFKNEGLNIVLQKMSTTNNMRDAITSGKIKICSALGSEMFFENNNMLPGNLYALYFNVLTKSRYQDGIVVKADSDIGTIEQLNGKSIGCYPASTVKVYLDMIAQNKNLSYRQTLVAPAEAFQLLDKGQLDAIYAIEPQLSEAKKNPNYKIIDDALLAQYVLEEIPVGVCAINGEFYLKYPEVAEKIQTALKNAVDFIEKDQAEAIKLGEKFIGVTEGNLSGSNLPEWKSGCEINHETLTKFLAFLHINNIVSSTVDHTNFIYCKEK
ncbi:MAG: ABC transporter substrate-binding protein [Bacteroidales bacterium]|jgi:ABC-type nitrate/sulfonate/bicarbonate transport system substrate-binding protein|nr:ABC transporter substrate-binding protein [Bacteroidales bacterium]